jgi:hypothetical protein
MKTIKGTKRDLVAILKGLLEVQELEGAEFGMAVAKNLKLLQDKLQDIEDMGQVSPQFLAVAREVAQLTQDEKLDEAKKLEDANINLLEERKTQLAVVDKALEKTASIKLYTIARRMLPKVITGKQIYGITKILE